jgi:hypothetical protein
MIRQDHEKKCTVNMLINLKETVNIIRSMRHANEPNENCGNLKCNF